MKVIIEYLDNVIEVGKATKAQKDKLKVDKPEIYDRYFNVAKEPTNE